MHLEEVNEYWWPVTVRWPVDGGKFQLRRFEALWRYEPEAIGDALSVADRDDREIVERFMVGWRGVTIGADRKEAPFTLDALQRQLKLPYVRDALARSLIESLSGIEPKNSETPPAGS